MDEGALIEQVSRFPALYNKLDPRYKLKLEKENAWRTKGTILGYNPGICEQKWSVIRSKYVKLKRDLKAMPSGSAAYDIPWPHFESMGFLDPYLTTRKTTTNFRLPAGASTSSAAGCSQTHQQPWDSMSEILCNSESMGFSPPTPFPTSKTFSFVREEEDDAEEPSQPPPVKLTYIRRTLKRKLTDRVENETEEASQTPSPQTQTPPPQTPPPQTPSLRPTPQLKKKTVQEQAFEKLGTCLDTYSKLVEKPNKKQPSNLGFCQTLANDLELLTPRDQTTFKIKIYSVLDEMLNAYNLN